MRLSLYYSVTSTTLGLSFPFADVPSGTAYLRINGIKAKDHPVMRELARVRQYMEKIKSAEENEARQNGAGLHLDKDAAGRFIKAALVGLRKSHL